jgi:hypothetical protein
VAQDPLEPELKAVLAQLQRAIVKHPFASQAVFSALVSEGRAYAQTPEGAELRKSIGRSELLLRIRSAWDIVTFGVLSDERAGTLPSVVIEALARAAAQQCFEARVFEAVDPVATERSAP